jgi:hypothetical protein
MRLTLRFTRPAQSHTGFSPLNNRYDRRTLARVGWNGLFDRVVNETRRTLDGVIIFNNLTFMNFAPML